MPLIPQLCILWGLPSSRWEQLVNNRRNAWQQVSYWVILLHLHIDRSEFNSFLGTDYQCLLAIFCLLCLKYSIVSAASGWMMFHLHLPNLFFFLYLVPNEHNRSAEARLLVLNFLVDFALWTQFKLKNDQTKRLRALYLLTFKILARYFPEYTIEVVFYLVLLHNHSYAIFADFFIGGWF